MIWIIVNGFIVWWVLPIKRVRIIGDQFGISNYFLEILVPQSSLRKIEEDLYNRNPSIRLYFDPPTKFGSLVRIMPPMKSCKTPNFKEVAALLQTILEGNQPSLSEE